MPPTSLQPCAQGNSKNPSRSRLPIRINNTTFSRINEQSPLDIAPSNHTTLNPIRSHYLHHQFQGPNMSHLTNPLATPNQLSSNPSSHLPPEIQDSIRFYTARLTQAAGILLRLPQDITAQANVLLFRFWLVDGMMEWEFSVRLINSPLSILGLSWRKMDTIAGKLL